VMWRLLRAPDQQCLLAVNAAMMLHWSIEMAVLPIHVTEVSSVRRCSLVRLVSSTLVVVHTGPHGSLVRTLPADC
jgi:hypothetical protein